MRNSALTEKRNSPLENMQRMKNGEGKKKLLDMAPVLPLTSLIDAFSIIVIYLLIGTQSGGLETVVPNNMKLPMADSGVGVESSPIVRIERGRYFVDEKEVRLSELTARLAEIKAAKSEGDAEILIQADQKMDYASLDPLLRASAQAGLQKLRFAVMPKK